MCVFFFRVCVVCVSLARRHGEEHASRGRALHWECAPRRNSKATCAKLCRILKNLHRLVTYPCDFPKIYTDWWLIHATFPPNTQFKKRLFAITMWPPPKQSVQICQLFHVTFQKTFRLLASYMTSGTFMCDRNSREFLNINGTHVDFTSNFLA